MDSILFIVNIADTLSTVTCLCDIRLTSLSCSFLYRFPLLVDASTGVRMYESGKFEVNFAHFYSFGLVAAKIPCPGSLKPFGCGLAATKPVYLIVILFLFGTAK